MQAGAAGAAGPADATARHGAAAPTVPRHGTAILTAIPIAPRHGSAAVASTVPRHGTAIPTAAPTVPRQVARHVQGG